MRPDFNLPRFAMVSLSTTGNYCLKKGKDENMVNSSHIHQHGNLSLS
jgi:hypothetical protein